MDSISRYYIDPERDWPPQRVSFELTKAGMTAVEIARKSGASTVTVYAALSWPSSELRQNCLRVIAQALGRTPHEMWPSIFDERGESRGFWVRPGSTPQSDPFNAAIVERLRGLIESVGGYKAMAERTGISVVVLKTYTGHGAKLPLSRAVTIARAAGVSLDWFATGEGPGPAAAPLASPTPAESTPPPRPAIAKGLIARALRALRASP